MPATMPFDQLLNRLRAGDEAAVRAFVETYEPYLRRTLRRRLAHSRCQAVADSADICQSVFASFMLRCIAGEFELPTREDLVKLLSAMARKKLAELMRRESATRRDRHRTEPLGSDPHLADGRAPEPSQILAGRELLATIRTRLSNAERHLFDQRQAGKSWAEIAEAAGVEAMVLRKRLSRALKQVALDIGLEDDDGQSQD